MKEEQFFFYTRAKNINLFSTQRFFPSKFDHYSLESQNLHQPLLSRNIDTYVYAVKMNDAPRLLRGNLVKELRGRDTPVLLVTEETHMAGTGSHFAREARLMSRALMSRVPRKATLAV